jgi:hypothetical protein
MRDPNAPEWFNDDIFYPANERDHVTIRHAQRVLRLDETGEMDHNTRASLRAMQSLFKIKVTGILDLATALKIEQIRNRFA